MPMVLVNKLEDGKEKMVLVNTMTLDPTQVAANDPNQLRNQLMHQEMKLLLEDVIATCKDIGSTNGHSNPDHSSDSDPSNLAATVVNGHKKAAEEQLKAMHDSQNTTANAQKNEDVKEVEKTQKIDPSKIADDKKKQMHDLIWNHNVFWALLHVAMEGNSSIFSILTEALGQNANLLDGNQYVSGIITKINDDIKDIVSMPDYSKCSAQQKEEIKKAIQDLSHELSLLSYVIDPSKMPGYMKNTPEAKKIEEAHQSLGPDLLKQLNTLVSDYNDEANYNEMLQQLEKKNPITTDYEKFWKDMTNESGSKSPGTGPTGIYSQTSSMITSLNTAGSKYMAQQNLDTKQVDEVEKLWTSAASTFKTLVQAVIGNVAN